MEPLSEESRPNSEARLKIFSKKSLTACAQVGSCEEFTPRISVLACFARNFFLLNQRLVRFELSHRGTGADCADAEKLTRVAGRVSTGKGKIDDAKPG